MNRSITYEQAKGFCKEFQTLVGQTLYCAHGVDKAGRVPIKDYIIAEVRSRKTQRGEGLFALALYDKVTGDTSDPQETIWYELCDMQELTTDGIVWNINRQGLPSEWLSTNPYRLKNYLLNKTNMEENRQEQLTVSDAASMPRYNGVYTITPELAAEWLKGNTHNRCISRTKLAFYVSQIREGAWRRNATEPIGLTREGKLIDGQHRLLAIIKAGIPTQMTVTWDAEEDDFKVINTGKNRSNGDVFTIAGIPSSHRVASVTKGLMMLMDNTTVSSVIHREKAVASIAISSSRSAKYTHAKLLAFYEEHVELITAAVKFGARLRKNSVPILSETEIAVFAAYLQLGKGHPREMATAFFTALCEADRHYPYLCNLHVRLSQGITGTSRLTGAARQNLIAKAWNMYLAGSNATKIPHIKDGVKIDFN